MKADFTEEYNRPTPTALYKRLGKLDYVAPAALAWLYDVAVSILGPSVREGLLDVGCSYGINTLLLNYGYSLQQVYNMASSDLFEFDQIYKWRKEQLDFNVVGQDISRNALLYAEHARLLTHAIYRDLERRSLSQQEVGLLTKVNTFVSSGTIGYVAHRTFEEILRPPNFRFTCGIATFAEWVPIDRILRTLRAANYASTTVSDLVFPQRRLADASESDWISKVRLNSGVTGNGRDGWLACHPLIFAVSQEMLNLIISEMRAKIALFDELSFDEIANWLLMASGASGAH